MEIRPSRLRILRIISDNLATVRINAVLAHLDDDAIRNIEHVQDTVFKEIKEESEAADA